MSGPERIQRQTPGRRDTDGVYAMGELHSDKSTILMRLLTGLVSTVVLLVGWLCIQQQEQGKVLVRMEERSLAAVEQNKAFHEEQVKQDLVINSLSLDLKNMQIVAAKHGWKEN